MWSYASYMKNVYRPLEMGNIAYTLRESNKIIMISPDNQDTHDFVDWWCEQNPGFPAAELWPEEMPELEFMNVPSLCKYIRFNATSQDIDKYLETPNIGYNPSIPDVYVAIVFDEYPLFSSPLVPSPYDLRGP